MNSYHISDYDIQALADNELSEEDAAFVKAYVQNNPLASKRYKQLLEQKKLLGLWWTDSKQ